MTNDGMLLGIPFEASQSNCLKTAKSVHSLLWKPVAWNIDMFCVFLSRSNYNGVWLGIKLKGKGDGNVIYSWKATAKRVFPSFYITNDDARNVKKSSSF